MTSDEMFRTLDQSCFASGQIDPALLPLISARGIGAIINNRPDGEEAGQPTASAIASAAEQAGVAYHHLPMGGLTLEMIAEARAAIDGAEGRVLLFCKSGMRSALLWAAVEAAKGQDLDQTIAAAARAGYELRAYRPILGQVADAFRQE